MKEFAVSVFGGLARSFEPYFEGIREDMKQAKIPYTMNEYVSLALMSWILVFFGVNLVFGFLLGLAVDIVSAAITSFTLSMLLSFATLAFFYFYPSMKLSSRAKSIEDNLPFASIYLSSLSSGKVAVKDMMKIISGIKSYGDIAKEFGEVVRNVEIMGMEVGRSLVKVAEDTPSRRLKELLYGIYFNLLSGSDLYQYLSEKAEMLMTEYRERIKRYSQQLGVFIEIYLTLIIIGSVFFIVLTSTMNMIGGASDVIGMQFGVVFVMLPAISLMFVLLFRTMAPE